MLKTLGEGTHASLLPPSFVLSLSRLVCCELAKTFMLNNGRMLLELQCFSLSHLCCFGHHLLPAIKGWLHADILLACSWSFMKAGEALEIAGRAEWWLSQVL